MRHFTFGRNNGLRVSALALGAGTFGTRWGYGAAPEDVPRIFDTFADAGGTFIDTAASYQVGEAEENLGPMTSPWRRNSPSEGPTAQGCFRRATAVARCSDPWKAACVGSAPTTSTCCGCIFPIS